MREPIGVVADGAGNIYLANDSDNRLRRIDSKTGLISTVPAPAIPVIKATADPLPRRN